jgi:pyroglutamyl-peptidase
LFLCFRARLLFLAPPPPGVPTAASHDAGRYLCNYLCWRAAEAARAGAPRVVAFIHVPRLQRTQGPSRQSQLTFDDLALAGEAILRATLAAR